MKKAGKAVLKRVPVAGKEVLAVKIISLTRKAGEGVPRSGKVVPETVNRVLLIRKAVLEKIEFQLSAPCPKSAVCVWTPNGYARNRRVLRALQTRASVADKS